MKNARITLSRTDLESVNYVQVFRPLLGTGLKSLELLLISEVISRHLNGQVLWTAQENLAVQFGCKRCTINRTVKRLVTKGYLVSELIAGEDSHRQLRLDVGQATVNLLLNSGNTTRAEKAPMSVVDPVEAPEVQPTQLEVTAVKESIKENKIQEAPKAAQQAQVIPVTPQVVQPTQAATAPQALSIAMQLKQLNASNTSVADIVDVRYPVGEQIAKDDFTKLSLWPAKGRGLSREDVILVLGWSGVIGTQYADQYISSGTMPADQTRQLDHCRSFASDLRHRLEKIHEDAKYGVDHSWDW